jgi:hypothetical protein
MKPDTGARQALGALLRDAREAMPEAELDALISRELDKGGKMDADFVEEAVKDAEGAQTAFDAAANWTAIEKKLDLRNRSAASKRRPGWTRAAAAAVAVIALATIGTAVTDAGRWDALVKVFRPFARTLGIHLNVQDVDSVGVLEKPLDLPQPGLEQEAVDKTIQDEREVPDTVRGIAAKPSWLPEGYAFHTAQVFNDFNESNLTISYRKGSTEFFVQTVVYADNDTLTAVNVLEKGDGEAEVVNGITIIENDGIVSAVREDGLTLHMVWGRLPREEIIRVIASINR